MISEGIKIVGSRVLVVAAHPDDEVLGCGATVARLSSEGVLIRALIIAEGATSRDSEDDGPRQIEALAALRRAAESTAAVLGAEQPHFGGLPDNRLDGIDLLEVVKLIAAEVAEFRPDSVFTHFGGDLNIDHQITHRAVLTACRALPDQTVRNIFCFETPSSSEWASADLVPAFQPSMYVDVSAFLETKLTALAHYDMEMRPFPHARSVESVKALAKWRGASAGLAAAEAFRVLRMVV